jgi:hypothetical protein
MLLPVASNRSSPLIPAADSPRANAFFPARQSLGFWESGNSRRRIIGVPCGPDRRDMAREQVASMDPRCERTGGQKTRRAGAFARPHYAIRQDLPKTFLFPPTSYGFRPAKPQSSRATNFLDASASPLQPLRPNQNKKTNEHTVKPVPATSTHRK